MRTSATFVSAGKVIISASTLLATSLVATMPVHAQSVTINNPQNRPVNVRSSVREIPFYCVEAILPVESEKDPQCFRADTRRAVSPVPRGYNLVVTDVVTNRNALSNGGNFFVSVGKASSGDFTVNPRFDFSGDPSQSPTIHFTSPYVVLHPGEKLRVTNGVRRGSGSTVDVFVSGYIVRTADLGR